MSNRIDIDRETYAEGMYGDGDGGKAWDGSVLWSKGQGRQAESIGGQKIPKTMGSL